MNINYKKIMKNNGFTWLERITVLLIIAILVTIVVGSLMRAKKEVVQNKQTTSSSIIDKFNRLAPLAAETGKPAMGALKDWQGAEPTIEQACGDIPNLEAKSSCEKAFNNDKNIQDCISRYSN
jgi:competence protein ComGC